MEQLRVEDPSAYGDLANGGVVVGLSGGADSLALTVGAVRAGLSVHAVVVDHGLQEGSDRVAATAAGQARELGATAEVVRVHVVGEGEGPAREARYEALGRIADGRPVLVAHTASDDAEGFLVALSRGSGTHSLAGMRSVSRRHHPAITAGAGWIGRPLLAATRADTEAECTSSGLTWWEDPHNYSQDFVRSRVRQELLPLMEDILGGAVRDNLARSARMLRDDADALDALALDALEECTAEDGGEAQGLGRVASLKIKKVATYSPAVRRRIYKHWLGQVAGPLTATHIHAIDALVAQWRGQGAVSVPWGQHWPTMNEDRRTSHRLVVRRVEKTLTIDHQLRQPYSEGR